jgi:hypothetical protein
MKKIIYAIGIVSLLNLILIVVLFAKISNLPIPSFGGTTNLDSLELSETLSVTGTTTLTGATTQTGALSVAANLNADGGLVQGGRYNYGETASMTLGADIICDYNMIQIDGDGDAAHDTDYNIGVSLSFPDDETLMADCMGTVGDYKQFIIDPTSSTSTTYIDIVETGNIMEFRATSAQADVAGSMMIRAEVFNTGTSLSWYFDAIDASVSYQP